MMIPLRRLFALLLAVALAGCAPCPVQPRPAPVPPAPAPLEPSRVEPMDSVVIEPGTDSARIIEVRMLTTEDRASGEFSPRVVRVRQGDVLRFRMADGNAAHHVAFAGVAGNARGIALPPDGPFLTRKDQSWQVRIDLPPGRYEFACLPHAPGHRGVLIVEEG